MFETRFRSLLDKASDPGDGGSGGGEKPSLTDDMRKEIGAMISGAFKSEGKRLITSAVTEGLKSALSKEALQPLFSQFIEELPDDEDGADNDDPGKRQPSAKPDPKVAALEAKLADLLKKQAEDAETLKKTQTEAREKDAMAALKSALAPHVKPEALDMAAALLFTAQKRVQLDDNGNPLFTVRKPPYAGASDEDVQMPLADGVQHWLKSQEGKFFVPAPSGAGNQPNGGTPRRVSVGGDGMPKYDQPATSDAEKIRRAAEREEAFKQRFPNLR